MSMQQSVSSIKQVATKDPSMSQPTVNGVSPDCELGGKNKAFNYDFFNENNTFAENMNVKSPVE